MSKLDLASVPVKTGSIYPAPYAEQMAGRRSLRLGPAGGLTQFGANLVILEPGARSSLRHWHRNEDEFVLVLQGTLVLIENEGETEMHAGDCAAFPAGIPNGHCLVNRTAHEARFLVVGTSASREVVTYADVDLRVEIKDGTATFTRKDGNSYIPPEDTA